MRHLAEIGTKVRAARMRLGFSRVGDLACVIGVDRRRLSAFELGRRPLCGTALRRLSEVLALPELASAAASARARGRREAEAGFLRAARVSRPRYDPPRDRDQSFRRQAAWKEEPDLMEALDLAHRSRPDYEQVQAFLASIASESWVEYLYPARELALPDTRPVRIAPNEIGYSHYALVDPLTCQAVGDRLWPALGLRRGKHTIVQFFNASIRTPRRTWTVDILQYSHQSRRAARWTVVEIDGDGHRSRWDREKEEQVGLATLRLSGEEIRQGHAWPRIERWLGKP